MSQAGSGVKRAASLREILGSGRSRHGSLITSSVTLATQTLILAVSGFAFWLIAARRFDAETVGLASALFTVVRVVNYAASLGLPVLVARYGSARHAASRHIFTWSVLVATVAAAFGSLVIAAMASDAFAQPLVEFGRLLGGLIFFMAALGLGVTAILDNRQIGLQRYRGFLARHAFNGLVRLPLVIFLASSSSAFLLWFALIFAGPVSALVTLVLDRKHLGPYQFGPVENHQEVTRYAGINYASLLLAQAPFVVAPLFVLASVLPEENAAFHIVWAIAELVFLVPNLFGKALLIEGAADRATLRSQTRMMLSASAGFAVVALIGSVPWAVLVPWVYGDSYQDSGAYLVTLVAAALPFAVTATALNVARIQSNTRSTLKISLALTLGVALPAAVLAPSAGATGVTVAWIVGHCFAALVAAPSIVQLLRSP